MRAGVTDTRAGTKQADPRESSSSWPTWLAVALVVLGIATIAWFVWSSGSDDRDHIGLRLTRGEGGSCVAGRVRRVPVQLGDGKVTECCNQDSPACSPPGACCALISLAVIEKLTGILGRSHVAFLWTQPSTPSIHVAPAALSTLTDVMVSKYGLRWDMVAGYDPQRPAGAPRHAVGSLRWSACNGIQWDVYEEDLGEAANRGQLGVASVSGLEFTWLMSRATYNADRGYGTEVQAPSLALQNLPWMPATRGQAIAAATGVAWPWAAAFVINVWTRPDRRAHAVNVGALFGIHFTLIEAWTPRNMQLRDGDVDVNPRQATLSREGVACTLSAMRAWKAAATLVRDPNAYVLFVEDDWAPRQDLAAWMPQLIADLAVARPDVVRLGRQPLGSVDKWAPVPNTALLVRASQGSGAWAYMVKRSALDTLIAKTLPIRYPLDFVIPEFDADAWPPSSHYDSRFHRGPLLMVDAQPPSAEPDLPNGRRGLIDELSTFQWKHSTSSDQRF